MSFKYERFLVDAIELCNLHRILVCIKHGHNIHVKNNLGQNLLIHLLKQRNFHDPFFDAKRLQVFQFLITHCHLDIYIVDYYNKNLLNWAANLNCTPEALYLLKTYPGDLDLLLRDQSGSCALHYAIEHGNEVLIHAIVDYLLRYRLRFDVRDNYNNTPDELARKLGFNHIADYLYEACRSTIHMSREISFLQQRPITMRTKTTGTMRAKTTMTMRTKTRTTTAKSIITILSNSLTSSSAHNLSDFCDVIEFKIDTAKHLNDWKAVAALRKYQRNVNEKNMHQIPIPTLKTNPTSTDHPKCFPIKTQPAKITSTHLLRVLEPQISSSYRQAFVPIYPRPIVPLVNRPPPSVAGRKTSMASSRRMSSVMSLRKRDSSVSQASLSVTRDGGSRLNLRSPARQFKETNSQEPDNDTIAPLRSRNLIAVYD